MLIRTFVFDRINCRWTIQWLTAGARAALPHLSVLTLVGLCGSSPPPPAYHIPPAPAPPVVTETPPGPWPQLPPAFGYAPPEGVYVPSAPIPIGPVLLAPGGPRETEGTSHDLTPEAPDFAPPAPQQLCDITPNVPRAPVPEPGMLWVFGAAALCLGLMRYLRVMPRICARVRGTVLAQRGQ